MAAQDRVLRTEFNQDNARLDEALNQLAVGLAGKAEQSDLAQAVSTLTQAVAGAAKRSAVRGLDSALAGQVNSVLLAAAYVSPEHRAAIERLWHCQVNEHYGMTETGLAGAVGCREPGGYHVWESGLYYEIIHPATGRPVPEGERGEIVVTTLNRQGMPFVRYRTGDMSRFLPGSCPCGSALRRLERVGDRPAEKKFLRPEPVF